MKSPARWPFLILLLFFAAKLSYLAVPPELLIMGQLFTLAGPAIPLLAIMALARPTPHARGFLAGAVLALGGGLTLQGYVAGYRATLILLDVWLLFELALWLFRARVAATNTVEMHHG